MTGVDVILPAGGKLAGDFARETGTEIKALLPLDGQTLLEHALDAVRGTEETGKVVVIGPEELCRHSSTGSADAVIQETLSGIDNVYRGLEWLREANQGRDADRVLIMTTDLPFVTSEAVSGFIHACPDDMDICVPLIARKDFEERFPGTTNFYVKLRDGKWMIGCAFLAEPRVLTANRGKVEAVFAARKVPVRMAALLGLPFILRYLTGRLTVAHVEDRCLKLLNCSGRAIRGCAPELAYDIDRLQEYRYALDHLT